MIGGNVGIRITEVKDKVSGMKMPDLDLKRKKRNRCFKIGCLEAWGNKRIIYPTQYKHKF